MEYSIRQLSQIAGVSARTLRYYDEIGLLKPLYVNEAGYRYYGIDELNLLQQILFYRERGFELKQIQKIIYQDEFDIMEALTEHLLELEEKRHYLDSLIKTVKQTIRSMKGECEMKEQEKFEVFKQNVIKNNEKKYGEEIRARFGNKSVDDSNEKMLHMSKDEWESFEQLEQLIKVKLQEAVNNQLSIDSKEVREIVKLHKAWLLKTWKKYNVEAHKGLASAYVEDKRFQSYYDQEVLGCAELLMKAIHYWADQMD